MSTGKNTILDQKQLLSSSDTSIYEKITRMQPNYCSNTQYHFFQKCQLAFFKIFNYLKLVRIL